MSKQFKFKQFSLQQDQCAMKIGTDGVLLGAWAPIDHNPNSVLDIGAGTGILSLMLAQRSFAETIDAIEIDENAYEQCVNNFEDSPWGDRLFCYHASLSEFTEEVDETYDLIVCNPPFFLPPKTRPPLKPSTTVENTGESRFIARSQSAMPFEQLLRSVSILLSENGLFTVVIPFSEEEKFIELASTVGLFNNKVCHVRGHASAEIKRSLMSFSFIKIETEISDLIIEVDRLVYTDAYVDLTKDFYLKM